MKNSILKKSESERLTFLGRFFLFYHQPSTRIKIFVWIPRNIFPLMATGRRLIRTLCRRRRYRLELKLFVRRRSFYFVRFCWGIVAFDLRTLGGRFATFIRMNEICDCWKIMIELLFFFFKLNQFCLQPLIYLWNWCQFLLIAAHIVLKLMLNKLLRFLHIF